jgi:Fe-S-cluster containining protein
LKIFSNPEEIRLLALDKTDENDRFACFLKSKDSSVIDGLVFKLNSIISPQIDCTKCGNCCQSLMIQVEQDEIVRLSDKFGITTDQFEQKYIECGSSTLKLMNTIPCRFLENNRCQIYPDRFEACKEFPALHIPAVTSRLFTVFAHYSRCAIIFNVIESLKEHFSESLNEEV